MTVADNAQSIDVLSLILASLISLITGGGLVGLLTLRQKRLGMTAQANDTNASADARIMTAAASLVEQSGTTVPALLERITRLEEREATREARLSGLLVEQATERAELTAWRVWAVQVLEWAAQAVVAVRHLGGDLDDPPAPPTSAQHPVVLVPPV